MKYYKREGRRFVETINPADRIGMYVDNSGLFFTKDKTQSSVGKCVMIEDGHYVVACIEDHYKELTFIEAQQREKWGMYTCSNAFIPPIELLSYTIYKYPELFNKQKWYMSSHSFSIRGSLGSRVLYLTFIPAVQYWGFGSIGHNYSLSLKVFYKIPIL